MFHEIYRAQEAMPESPSAASRMPRTLPAREGARPPSLGRLWLRQEGWSLRMLWPQLLPRPKQSQAPYSVRAATVAQHSAEPWLKMGGKGTKKAKDFPVIWSLSFLFSFSLLLSIALFLPSPFLSLPLFPSSCFSLVCPCSSTTHF